ncbi:MULTISPECIES: mannose-1-phosphate guanyltransferase [Pseudanabaena]|uniref:Mannose-1-phosphate guanylyltransferase, Phosphoglucosamine mutase n=2 Tax=Pseudanabaena TaxID=1152 RepID=L8N0Z6_9CYAN|nr:MULTISPECIES: mannose-1-phosphate guanyltransferase [Pseudanabaena]ELS32410.1 Mannose-1-phosphate guanylyltransferase, Phosphoglucosamine mutase [Pseudanabaena biceps PCC 7429]MDG3495364.1 mannose-1-phosphate guanyltransferase [Pseudanabaena catenata USMAC16]
MRAVLMAGGSGTRLRPLTCDMPKPMVSVLNRPITEHILNLLKRHDIREVIATLHYLPDVIREHFGDGSDFGVNMMYVVEEDQPLGTAGCVKNVESLLNSTFLVISGDSITDFDLTAAIKFHRAKKSQATLILRRVSDPMAFGVVITDEEDRIKRFLEKPSTSEVFSDTVNTGIYILEPEVLNFLPVNQPSDFSNDLFPLLLAKNVPMYGYIASGYWCDIGSLDAYRQAQYDAIRGRVHLDMDYVQLRTGLWIGKHTVISPTVQIEPPVLIGSNCAIGDRTKISAGTIIGDRVTIGADCDLQRPIVGNSAMIAEECHLWACTISRNVRVSRRAHVMEGAVVGSNSVIGEEARVFPNVRIWPSKHVEAGATLTTNLIWGAMASRNLFGQYSVSGLANVDITPEFAVKLGAAYGATLRPNSHVMVSRDQRTICRMLTRSLISGLMSVGINVENLEATAIPISRFIAPSLGVVGGIHVRVHPDRNDCVTIEFLDSNGININKATEKKIEGTFFKEDFRRARIEEIGEISYPTRVLDYYNTGFAKNIDVESIRFSDCKKIVIDYVYAVSGAVLPRILGKFSTDVVVLNASLNEVAPAPVDREKMLTQLTDVVKAVRANFGVQVFANGEKFILIDELGKPIRDEILTGLMVEMALMSQYGGTIVVPVSASGMVELIAERHAGKVIRTRANPTALMATCHSHEGVVLGGSAEMGFIFPQLHPGFDAMFSIAKIMEWITLQKRSLSQVRLHLPRCHFRKQLVRCPWSIKGTLMRHLVESYGREKVELIDGVKVFYSDFDWVLVLPDASDPLVHVFANGFDTPFSNGQAWAEQHLQDVCSHIEGFCKLQIALSKDSVLLDN